MRRRLAALCLLGGLGTLGACAVQAQSPVWAIHGTHNTVYLAESVHLLKASDARLPAAFDTAYAGARTIVMEIDLSNLDTEHMQAYMLEHAALKNGTTLRQAIGEQRFAKLGAEAARLGLPLEVLETLEPWAVALTLTDLEYLRLGFDPEQGVEKQIERRARADQKPMLGLETLEEQLGQLEKLSPEQQARFLELTMEEMHEAEHDSFPELFRALVTERNRRWLPQIERFLKDDHDYMVVVGALHVVGEQGLLEMMRHDGYAPVPVRAAQ